MEYDFEIGREDEVILREAKKIHERTSRVGLYEAIAPLVRLTLALLAALGVQSVREALRRIKENENTLADLRRSLEVMRHNYETSPTVKVAGEIAAAMGMPNASAVDLLARVKALFAPVDVEADITSFVTEFCRCGDVSAIDARAIVRPLVEDRTRLRREIELEREKTRLLSAPVDIEAEVANEAKNIGVEPYEIRHLVERCAKCDQRVERLSNMVQALQSVIDGLEIADDAPDSMQARDEPPFPPIERLYVAALVTDPAGRVAVIESAKEGRAWELPGGKVELSETPCAAAIREVAEEAGVQLAEDALQLVSVLRGTPKPGAAFASVIHVFRARAEGKLRAGSDAKGACWMQASAVLDLQANGRLSDLQSTHDVLLPWARRQTGAQ